MKPITVRDQVKLGPTRCLVLSIAGMYYRLTRSAITILILSLAVAFLAYFGIAIVNLVAALFGVGGGWGLAGTGGLGLLLCVAGVALASFSLVLDFDAIETGVAAGLPEKESWRAAFGLTVTLVWLYLEILRLLAILNRS